MTNILFILKYRSNETFDPNSDTYKTTNYNSGVYLSAKFLADILDRFDGINAKIEHAIDNNCIDRLVTENKADIVIIEAFWVVPEKFDILTQLHPNVKWIVRNHSAMPFVAVDSVIVDWSIKMMEYPNVYLGVNDLKTSKEFKFILGNHDPMYQSRVLYLPNYYPVEYIDTKKRKQFSEPGYVNIGCFGALRQLKNHLPQAVAAIQYANSTGRKLKFHINCVNDESSAHNPILKSLENLFEHMPNAELVKHDWLPHEEFLKLCKTIDISLQVSFTETFNIVTADMISAGTPVIVSPEIDWVPSVCQANPTSNNSILFAIKRVMFLDKFLPLICSARRQLIKFSKKSLRTWMSEISKLSK